jgi:hypothetical protein
MEEYYLYFFWGIIQFSNNGASLTNSSAKSSDSKQPAEPISAQQKEKTLEAVRQSPWGKYNPSGPGLRLMRIPLTSPADNPRISLSRPMLLISSLRIIGKVGSLRVSSPLCMKMYELICSQIWLMANADHSCTPFASPPSNGPVRYTYRYKYHSPTGGSPYDMPKLCFGIAYALWR